MQKQKIHWFEWDCPSYSGHQDSYTNSPGLITCKSCLRKLKCLPRTSTRRPPAMRPARVQAVNRRTKFISS